MLILSSHTVPKGIEPTRIYDYCLGLFSEFPTRKGIKKAIKKGEIRLNGNVTSTGFWLKGGELIETADLELTAPKPYRLALDVLFEDEHIAVINKPAGLLSSGNAFKTVTNALQFNVSPSAERDKLPWPIPAHRLDKATSGIMVVAKTRKARAGLGQQFENAQIQKTYHAVVLGKVEHAGKLCDPIGGKAACTGVSPLKTVRSLKSDHLSLLSLQPETGRTHQIRIHLSGIGHAILGDPIYSPEQMFLKHKGMFLCATKIRFTHPTSNQQMTLEIPIPQKFEKRMQAENKRWIRHKGASN